MVSLASQPIAGILSQSLRGRRRKRKIENEYQWVDDEQSLQDEDELKKEERKKDKILELTKKSIKELLGP